MLRVSKETERWHGNWRAPTRVQHLEVILHMEEVGHVEFIQMGGILWEGHAFIYSQISRPLLQVSNINGGHSPHECWM